MPQYSDPSIPTLTQRAEPTVTFPHDVDGPDTRHRSDELPVLTDKIEPAPWDAGTDMAGGAQTPHAAVSATAISTPPDLAVLRSALQAELEHALDLAVEQAAANLRARLEADLPDLIDRAIAKVRPG